MDLNVGDRVQVISNINVRFMLPEEEYINYILIPSERFTIIEKSDVKMLLLLGEGVKDMGAEVKYSDRDKLIKI